MWALRRTCVALRSQTFSIATIREISASSYANHTRFSEPSPRTSDGSLLLKRYSSGAHHCQNTSTHLYSSLAGTKSSGDEDDHLEDGFSELEVSEEDDVPQNETEVKKGHQRSRASSALFKAIMDSPTLPVQKALEKWLEKGDSVTRSDISVAMLELRNRKMYEKALQLSEWLESRKQIEFNENDYSSRVDLIAKVHGLQKAENYIEKIPESSRGEVVYRTLLANCVRSFHATKAEQVFNKMKDLNFPITTFACNQLLLLYKRTNRKKISDVLLLMEKENVKPSLFTYTILVDIKGLANDIDGMEKTVEKMKSEGIEPDSKLHTTITRRYIEGGLKEKAKLVLQQMEGSNLKRNRWVCSLLLPLYAALGSADDVKRVWEVCESNPRLVECMSAIDAWGKLKRIDEAEAVFNQMLKKLKKAPSKYYAAMLKVYANNKMLSKGKNLVKEMAESGCEICPFTWEALVKLYVEAGEIEKADAILRRASEQKNPKKVLFTTYMMVMDQYAKRGDVRNAEKVFDRMRQEGYVPRLRQYHSLMRTYVNAKAPAYGFRERMKADNVFPNKSLAVQLDHVETFKRTDVLHLLD